MHASGEQHLFDPVLRSQTRFYIFRIHLKRFVGFKPGLDGAGVAPAVDVLEDEKMGVEG